MNFNKHYNLEGQHAFLGASKYHWVNYDEDKLTHTFRKMLATQRGTELHDYASHSIKLRQKLPKSKKTLNSFVNDCIGYKMTSEQPLCYSENCFGTADAIDFRNNRLRIFDLKTGEIPAHMEQLMIYAALFCLEYRIKPVEIINGIELRIYQSDEIVIYEPEPEEIVVIIDKIVTFDKIISKIKDEEN